jgi:hypothetical protein
MVHLFLIIQFISVLLTVNSSFIKVYGDKGPNRGIHIIETSTGDLVIVGNTMTETKKLDVYLLKVNKAGDTLWTRKFGGAEDDNGWCVKETADQGYIITGFTESYGAKENDIYLLKTDIDGNEIWHKIYKGTGDDIAWSLSINKDQGYTIAGQTTSTGNGKLDGYLIRTDAEGNVLWSKTFGGTEVDRFFSVDLAKDGSILLAGLTYSSGAGDRDAYLVKTDESGNIEWEKTFGGPGYDNAHTVIVNRQNEVMLTGYGDYWNSFGSRDMFLTKLTMSGDEKWTKTYGGTEHDHCMTVFQTNDNGYILTGYTQSFGKGSSEAYVVKTNSTCHLLWSDSYGTPAPDSGYDIIQSSEGAYFFTGMTQGFGDDSGDLLLVKIDPEQDHSKRKE